MARGFEYGSLDLLIKPQDHIHQQQQLGPPLWSSTEKTDVCLHSWLSATLKYL